MGYYDPNARLDIPYTGLMSPYAHAATSAPPGPTTKPALPTPPPPPPMGMSSPPPWISVPPGKQSPLWAMPALTTGLSLAVPGADPASALLGGVNSLAQQQSLRAQADDARRKYELDVNKYNYDVSQGERQYGIDAYKSNIDYYKYLEDQRQAEQSHKLDEKRFGLENQRVGLEGRRVDISQQTIDETKRHNQETENVARGHLGISQGTALKMDKTETDRLEKAVADSLNVELVEDKDTKTVTPYYMSSDKQVDPADLAQIKGLATDIYNTPVFKDGRQNPGYRNPEVAAQMAKDILAPNGLHEKEKPIEGTSTYWGFGGPENFVGIKQDEQPSAPSAPPQPSAPSAPPQPGAVEGGYRFKGGDPADPRNWEPVY